MTVPELVSYDPSRAWMATCSTSGSVQVHNLVECGRKAVAWLEDDGLRCHQGPVGGSDSRWKTVDELPSPSQSDPDRFKNSKVTCLALGPATSTRVLALGLSTGHVLVYELDAASMKLATEPTFVFHGSAAAVSDLKFAPQPAADPSLLLAASFRDGFVRTYRGAFDLTGEAAAPTRTWIELASVCVAGSPAAAPSALSACPPALCLAWRPFSLAAQPAASQAEPLQPLLAVGTGEGASIWALDAKRNGWSRAAVLASGGAPCVCVDWAANHGVAVDLVALGRGKDVEVWGVSGSPSKLEASRVASLEGAAGSAVWKVEFDVSGLQLAASFEGPAAVRVWAPNLGGRWDCVLSVGGAEAEEGGMM